MLLGLWEVICASPLCPQILLQIVCQILLAFLIRLVTAVWERGRANSMGSGLV